MKPALVIVGLGNPGKSYEKTRHNVGFRALDVLSKAFGTGDWKESEKFKAVTQEARILTFPILLVKPQTYMNSSADCVKKIVDFYKLDVSREVLVVVDDIDLPLADVRFRTTGGPGTHNGLRSLVTQFGEAFPRLRVGLGDHPKGEELAAWVLSTPTKEETEALDAAVQSLPDRVREYVLERGSEEPSAEEEPSGN